MLRRILIVVAGAAIVILAVAWVVAWYYDNPRIKTRRFIEAIARRDWSAVYELNPSGYFGADKVSPEQFVTFMQEIGEGVQPQFLADYRISENSEANSRWRGQYICRITFPNAPPFIGKVAGYQVRALNTRDGWTIPTNDLPWVLLRMRSSDTKERMQILARALEASKMRGYRQYVGGPVTSLHRIRLYLAGQIPSEEIAVLDRRPIGTWTELVTD